MTITLAIIILTCLISFSAMGNEKLLNDLLFYPPAVANQNQYYRFITHGLVHADFLHLAFNMYAFYGFGTGLEQNLFSSPLVFGSQGKFFFLALYVLALIVASIPDFFKHRHDYHYRSLGASGAVSAVIFACILLSPRTEIGLLFIPIGIPGYIFGILFLAISALLDRKGGGNINHGAHLWGAIFGLAFTFLAVRAFGHIEIVENFLRQIRG